MKKVLLAVAAATFLIATPSCKKGENDPFLSLKSRKARLAGEYTIDSWMQTATVTNTDGDKVVSTITINGTSGTATTVTTPDGEPSTTATVNIAINMATFKIEKDGTWESTINTTSSWSEDGDGIIADSYDFVKVETSNETGNWSFLGGQPDEFKNKERVVFNVLNSNKTEQTSTTINFSIGGSTTTEDPLETTVMTNAEGEVSTIYEIDMLKSKEIVLKQDLSGNDTESTTTGGITFSAGVTQTGNMELKLVAK